MKNLQFMIKPNLGETKAEFKARLKMQLKDTTEKTGQDTEPTVTSTYPLSFLVIHPRTKAIVLKYLLPINPEVKHLEHMNCTLDALAADDMGGGIPYETMMQLKEELNTPVLWSKLST